MLQTNFRKLLTLVDDAADASLFHLGRVLILRAQSFSVKTSVLSLCNELSNLAETAGISGTVLFGHGWEAGLPWSTKEGSQDTVVWSQSKLPDFVMGDCSRIVRVLRHLAEYALHRTSKGGKVQIQVTYWPAFNAQTQDRYTFSVSDTAAALDTASVYDRFQSYFSMRPLAVHSPARTGGRSDLTLQEDSAPWFTRLRAASERMGQVYSPSGSCHSLP